MKLSDKSLKILVYILILLSCLNFLRSGIIRPYKTGGYDFRALYAAGIEAQQTEPDLYKSIIYRKTGFGYLPIITYVFIPFTHFSEQTATTFWLALNILLTFLMLYLIIKINKLVFSNYHWKISVIMVLNFNPLHETLKWGQVNIIIYCLMLLCLYFYLLDRKYSAGIFLGLAIVFKIIPALLFMYFILRKQFKIFFSAGLLIVLLLLVSIGIFGTEIHKQYFTKKIAVASKFGYKGNIYDQSFQAMSFRLFWADNGYTKAWTDNFKLAKQLSAAARFGSLIILFLFLYSNRAKSNQTPLIKTFEFSLSAVAIHLFHSLSWEHHFVFTLMLFIYSFIYIKETKQSKLFLFLLLAAYIIIAARYGYDNKLFTEGILILFTGIKLYGIILLYFISMILILKKKRLK